MILPLIVLFTCRLATSSSAMKDCHEMVAR